MRCYVGVGVVVAAVLAAGLVAAPARGPASPDEQDFGDRVLGITLRTVDEAKVNRSGYFTKVRVRRLGDQFFLTGEPVTFDDKPDPWAGMAVWLPVSEVLQIVEFKDAAAAKKAFEQHDAARPPREPK